MWSVSSNGAHSIRRCILAACSATCLPFQKTCSYFSGMLLCAIISTDLNLSEIRQNEIKKALVTKQVHRFDAVFTTSGQVSFM